MFSGSRSMLQASIDENCEVIERLVSYVPRSIHSNFKKAEDKAKEIALHSCDFDREVYQSMFNSIYAQTRPEDEDWMINEFYRSMVLIIYAYAETTIKSLLSNPEEHFRGNYLCCAFNKLNKERGLGLKKIGEYWKTHQSFTKIRNDIAHRHRDVSVSKEEIFDAIDGAHCLLRNIADAIENNKRYKDVLKIN